METKKRQKKDYEKIIRELKIENLELKSLINDDVSYISSLHDEIDKLKSSKECIPNWKYRKLLARIDKQDELISKISNDLDGLGEAFLRFSKLYAI